MWKPAAALQERRRAAWIDCVTSLQAHSAASKPALVYIDMAYDLKELSRQNRIGFLDARNRAGLFSRVFSLHPVAGLVQGETAGRFRIRRTGAGQVVLDGFHPSIPRSGLRRLLNLLYSQARMVCAAVRLARRPDVVVICSTDVFYLGLIALVAAKFSGKPFAVAAYQNQDELFAQSGRLAFPRLLPWRWLEKAVQKLVLSRADVIEAPTENMRKYLLANGARENAITMLPVARLIDPIHLSPPETRESADSLIKSWGLDPQAPRMVLISRLIDLKLVEDGVAAMIGICRVIPDTIGLVFGEGELASTLQKSIDEAGLASRIKLVGKVDQGTLSQLCIGAIIISPLTGMALVEASLAGGVPIVYDRDWQPEFVQHGINGFVVPFRDVDAMVQQGVALSSNPSSLATLRERSRSAGLSFADPDLHREREKEVFGPIVDRWRARLKDMR